MGDNSISFKRRNSLPAKIEIPATYAPTRHRSSLAAGIGYHRPFSSPPLSSSFFSGVNFELVSIKNPSYVSLKDLIPSSPSILSPPAAAVSFLSSYPSGSSAGTAVSGDEISIRNRLVKQAARAYLQPMPATPSASGRRHWWFYSGRFFKPSVVVSARRWIINAVTRVCNWLDAAMRFILRR